MRKTWLLLSVFALAGCDQCVLRPCGFCYDNLFQTLAPTSTSSSSWSTATHAAPAIPEAEPAPMRH